MFRGITLLKWDDFSTVDQNTVRLKFFWTTCDMSYDVKKVTITFI